MKDTVQNLLLNKNFILIYQKNWKYRLSFSQNPNRDPWETVQILILATGLGRWCWREECITVLRSLNEFLRSGIEYWKGIKLLFFGCINIIESSPFPTLYTQTMRYKCLKHVLLPQNEETCHHRRRVKTEEKAKVVASVWGDSYFAWDDFEE